MLCIWVTAGAAQGCSCSCKEGAGEGEGEGQEQGQGRAHGTGVLRGYSSGDGTQGHTVLGVLRGVNHMGMVHEGTWYWGCRGGYTTGDGSHGT